MGVEVSHDVNTEVKKIVKIWCEIGGTAEDRRFVNVVKVDGDIVDNGCNAEVLSEKSPGNKESVGRWMKVIR